LLPLECRKARALIRIIGCYSVALFICGYLWWNGSSRPVPRHQRWTT
jgi:hypothetical protein